MGNLCRRGRAARERESEDSAAEGNSTVDSVGGSERKGGLHKEREQKDCGALRPSTDDMDGTTLAPEKCEQSRWKWRGYQYRSYGLVWFCAFSIGFGLFSLFSCNSLFSVLSTNSAFSVFSLNSFASVFSTNSALSVKSLNSFMTYGCTGESYKVC